MLGLDPEVEEKIRADERAKVSEALRRAALGLESRLPEVAAAPDFLAGSIFALCRQADLLDAVTANGGYSDGMVMPSEPA